MIKRNATPSPGVVSILLASLALPCSAQKLASVTEIPSPFLRLEESDRALTIGFDAADYALLSNLHENSGGLLRIRDVPLPLGRTVDLNLQPTRVFEPGARAIVVHEDGSQSYVAPRAKTFFGHVEGGGTVFLGISPTMLHGYVEVGTDQYFLSAGGSNQSGKATIAHSSLFANGLTPGAPGDWCGFSPPNSPFDNAERESMEDEAGVQKVINSGATVRMARVFLEADAQFRAAFSSDQDCIDYVTLLTSASSSIYRRDIGSVFSIPDGYLRVWNTTPPWGQISTFSDISDVQNWWTSNANPDRTIGRAAVHVLTRPVFGGVAFSAGGLCNNQQGYEISSLNGSFPYPVQHTSHANWDLIVYSHEFGHTFGSGHTFNYSPPIPCFEGSGPDNGTIMSYCHLEAGGNNNIGMRFHVRVQNNLIQRFGSANCLDQTLIENGDYDFDGDIDAADIATADGILAQGFVSRAANAVFDFDGDGDFDALDRELLDLVTSGMPPAEALMYNGAGTNEECYFTLNNPLLGRTWSSQVLAFGVGTITFILAYTQPISGITLATGELLVHPGSNFLFSSVANSQFLFGVHEMDVPLDTNLAGFMAYVQGFRLDQACNALQLRVNFY